VIDVTRAGGDEIGDPELGRGAGDLRHPHAVDDLEDRNMRRHPGLGRRLRHDMMVRLVRMRMAVDRFG
jgi:hypothetical protein